MNAGLGFEPAILTPTVTPIQPQLQSTVGRHGEIVIVLD